MVAQLETPTLHSAPRFHHSVTGQIQIFTGPHRSFFPNVIAEALRISGQGTPVLVVQLLKGGIRQGHHHPVHLGQNLQWIRCDLPRCIDTPELDEAETASLRQLWQFIQTAVFEEQYSLVVLDELSVAVNFGLIPETEVINLLERRPRHLDIILTGPDMPPAIMDMADQITEIRRSQRL